VRLVTFHHSLVSGWNHGNSPFLRGVGDEWQRRGHEVVVYEPANGAWMRSSSPVARETGP
jgi:spore maturation protein CgeB